MNCLKCSGFLKVEKMKGYTLNVCTMCMGIWMEKEQLENFLKETPRIKKLLLNKVDDELVKKKNLGFYNKNANCPVCQKQLVKTNSLSKKKYKIEICPENHGMWMDGKYISRMKNLKFKLFFNKSKKTLILLGIILGIPFFFVVWPIIFMPGPKDFIKATNQMNKAAQMSGIEKELDNTVINYKAKEFIKKGAKYLLKDKPEKAIKYFNKAIEEDSLCYLGYKARIKAYEMAGNKEAEIIKDYEKLILIDPEMKEDYELSARNMQKRLSLKNKLKNKEQKAN